MVTVTLTELATVEDGVDGNGRSVIVCEVEGNRSGMRMKLGRIVVGFEERNVKDGMKTGEVRRETELVCKVRDGAINGERTKTSMIELIRRACGLDMPAEQPYELARLVFGAVLHPAVVIAGLTLLRTEELHAKLIMKTGKASGHVSGGWDNCTLDRLRFEGGMEAEVGKEWSLLCRLILVIVESELGEGQVVDPVILLVGDICTEVRLERLVGALGQTISLRMVCRRLALILRGTTR